MKKIYSLVAAATITFAAQSQVTTLYFTGTKDNIISTANADGTGTPTILVNNAASAASGPAGIHFENDSLYYCGGNQSENYAVHKSGAPAPHLMANVSGMGSEHHSIVFDTPNNRMFVSMANDGIWVANLDGTGTATQIYPGNGNNIVCVTYDPVNAKVYAGNVNDDEIYVMDPDGANSSTIYTSTDGVAGPRQMDFYNGNLYWTNRDNGDIMMADGTNAPVSMFAGHPDIYGIFIDQGAGDLYFTAFENTGSPYNDSIFVANADGTGTAALLHAGDFGQIRDITGEVVCAVDTSVTTNNFTLTSNSSAADSYQWIDCNNGNQAIAGATSVSYSPTANGDYAVIVTEGSCVDTSLCHTIMGLGVNDLDMSNVSIYPNPASNNVTVEVNGLSGNLSVTMLNAVGQVVINKEFNDSKNTINVANLRNGVYFIKIQDGNNVVTRRFIKK